MGGVHRAAEHADALADQRARVLARRDHRARALVADGQRLAEPRLEHPHPLRRHLQRQRRTLGGAARLHRRQVGGAEQQPEIAGIDRRRLDPNQHLVGPGVAERHLVQAEAQLALGRDEGTKLEGGGVGHGGSPCAPAMPDKRRPRNSPDGKDCAHIAPVTEGWRWTWR